MKANGGWKWRRMCCVPVVLLFELGILCVLTTTSLSIIYSEYGSNGRLVVDDVDHFKLLKQILFPGMKLPSPSISLLGSFWQAQLLIYTRGQN